MKIRSISVPQKTSTLVHPEPQTEDTSIEQDVSSMWDDEHEFDGLLFETEEAIMVALLEDGYEAYTDFIPIDITTVDGDGNETYTSFVLKKTGQLFKSFINDDGDPDFALIRSESVDDEYDLIQLADTIVRSAKGLL